MLWAKDADLLFVKALNLHFCGKRVLPSGSPLPPTAPDYRNIDFFIMLTWPNSSTIAALFFPWIVRCCFLRRSCIRYHLQNCEQLFSEKPRKIMEIAGFLVFPSNSEFWKCRAVSLHGTQKPFIKTCVALDVNFH